MQAQRQYKSSQATRDRAKAWAAAHPERRREIQREHYARKFGLKPVLAPIQRFESHILPEPSTGCWLWTSGVDRDGYGKASIDGKGIRANRLSWLLHKGDIAPGLQVLHRCDVPPCVNPAHLWLGTSQENDADKRKKGRQFVQPIHRPAKVSEDDVREMRRLRGKETIVSLAKRFGLHHSQVSRIQRGLQWPHIPPGE